MTMVWTGVAIGVGTLGGAAISADASRSAARTQAQAAGDASQVQLGMFNTVNAQQQPFIQGGYGANTTLLRLMGINPSYNIGGATGGSSGPGGLNANSGLQAGTRLIGDQYLPEDVETIDRGNGYYDVMQGGQRIGTLAPGGQNGRYTAERPAQYTNPQTAGTPAATGQQPTDSTGLETGYLTQTFGPEQFRAGIDPGYAWRLQQGTQTVQNTGAAGSGARSGNALRSLMDYGQGAASQEYGAAFDRFQTQQGNIYQRLLGLTNLGQNAAAGVGAQGVQTASTVGGNIVGAGNAAAAGRIGAANAYSGAIDNLGGLAYLVANRDK